MTKTSPPLVSVIIPTYNRCDLLPLTIKSVIDQTYKNIEILIVDDGSTDQTNDVVKEIANQVPNLLYIKKQNGGCASARNKGLEKARGGLLTFIDSDDQWEIDAIEKMVGVLIGSQVELVYSPSIEVFPSGKQFINIPVSAGDPGNLAVAHFMDTNIRNGSFIFARSALDKVGFIDESLRYNEDSDFFQRLAINCKADYLPDPTVRVLNHPGGKSHNRVEVIKALIISMNKVLEAYPDFAEKLGNKKIERKFQLSIALIEADIMESKWEEANELALQFPGKLGSGARLSISIKNRIPLQIDNLVKKAIRSVNRKLTGKYGDSTN